jgi:DNA-binding LytR/AlgR family response regulator
MFVKAHEAFVLNIAHIVRLARTEAEMKGNRIVPVSRSQYAAVRDAYLSFRLG